MSRAHRPRTRVITRRAPGNDHRQEAYYRTDYARWRKCDRHALAAATREYARRD